MSYKFDIHRCTECGAVWFDPPEKQYDDEDEHGKQIPPMPCGIQYQRPNGVVSTCDGVRKPFAVMDSDTFVGMHKDWMDPSA